MYWRTRFLKVPFDSIVPNLSVDQGSEKYYLLSTLMKEDKEIRHKLRLEHVLQIQESERTSTDYKRDCLFCRLNFEGINFDFVSS